MPKVAYFDCPTGISGDMCLGALVDAGVPLEYLTAQLGRLGLAEEYHLRAEFVQRNGQQATKVEVDLQPSSLHRMHSVEPSHKQLQGDGHNHSHQSDYDPEDHSSAHSHSHAHSHSYEQSRQPQGHSHPHNNSQNYSPLPAKADGHTGTGEHQPSDFYPHAHSRNLPEIEALILAAKLPERATRWSLAVFRRLAEAEAAVHGIPPEQVHFHEVGATDAIVDIVGTCLGLDYLKIDDLCCSALPIGGGTVWAAHGRLPVPAPAVLKLWEIRQVPLYSNGISKELVTPTGAALVTVLASQFGPPPPLILQKVGLGAGAKDLSLPNILRLWIGEVGGEVGTETLAHQVKHRDQIQSFPSSGSIPQPTTSMMATDLDTDLLDTGLLDADLESVAVLETQIDDLSPQAIGYVMSVLLGAGALDVFTQSVGMKKSRSGLLLTVICRPDQITACEVILFRETTTLGIRRSFQQRMALPRWFEQVLTPYGPVRVKLAGWRSGEVTNVQPEYEDCVQLAQQHQVAWREVHRLALQAWHETASNSSTNSESIRIQSEHKTDAAQPL